MRLPEYDTADATELASWVARGDVHPRELVAAALERIEARNGALNAVVHIDAEPGEVVELLDQALEVADAVAVGVAEGADQDLVEHRGLEPLRLVLVGRRVTGLAGGLAHVCLRTVSTWAGSWCGSSRT